MNRTSPFQVISLRTAPCRRRMHACACRQQCAFFLCTPFQQKRLLKTSLTKSDCFGYMTKLFHEFASLQLLSDDVTICGCLFQLIIRNSSRICIVLLRRKNIGDTLTKSLIFPSGNQIALLEVWGYVFVEAV